MFDYAGAADLFPGRPMKRSSRPRYHRFDTAAEAIKYAIEELPVELLRGCILEVNSVRVEGAHIRALYEASDYPLSRGAAA